jgi:hypothetical protein
MNLISINALRSLLGTPSLSPLRYQLWKKNARRDATATVNFSRSNQLTPANIFTSSVLDSNRSKTLFILGSGWSINSITTEMFSHIEKHQSVGINFWFFHDFVPSLFSFDAGKVNESEAVSLPQSLATLGRLFARSDVIDASPKIMVLRPYKSDPRYLVPIPAALQHQVWVHGRANVVSSAAAPLLADLKLLLTKISHGRLPRSVLPDNGSSVARLIFLGLAQGFHDIVLAGIDLDSRPHFWFAPQYMDRYPEYVRLFPPPDNQPHGTALAIDRPLGNREFITSLNQAMIEQGAGRLWVASPESQLGGTLPQYPWPSPRSKT